MPRPTSCASASGWRSSCASSRRPTASLPPESVGPGGAIGPRCLRGLHRQRAVHGPQTQADRDRPAGDESADQQERPVRSEGVGQGAERERRHPDRGTGAERRARLGLVRATRGDVANQNTSQPAPAVACPASSSFSGALRSDIGPTTKRDAAMPSTRADTAAEDSEEEAPVRLTSRSGAQKVVANSMPAPQISATQNSQKAAPKPLGRPAVAAVRVPRLRAGTSGIRSRRRAATIASTAAIATAGRHPQPSRTNSPSTRGASSPNAAPTPLASVTAAGPAMPWCTERAGVPADTLRVPPTEIRRVAVSVAGSVVDTIRAATPPAKMELPMIACTRRPQRSARWEDTVPLIRLPTAIAVPCSPARAREMPCSCAISGIAGENAYRYQPQAMNEA